MRLSFVPPASSVCLLSLPSSCVRSSPPPLPCTTPPPPLRMSASTPPPPPPDQWSQFRLRDEDHLFRASAHLEQSGSVDMHHHIFTKRHTGNIFEKAARRHAHTAAAWPVTSGSGGGGRRIVIARQVADPAYGVNRGRAPHPPRYCVLESFARRADSQAGASATGAWLDAVDDVGGAVTRHERHVVRWVRRFEARCGIERAEELEQSGGRVVVCEILNANWEMKGAVERMGELLDQYARKAVSDHGILFYDVLQSPEAPACFKCVEIHSSMNAYLRHMESVDPVFEKEALKYRAAVNRVRQVYTPIVEVYR